MKGKGGICQKAGGAVKEPFPLLVNKRVVRIPLECFLVQKKLKKETKNKHKRNNHKLPFVVRKWRGGGRLQFVTPVLFINLLEKIVYR